MKRLALLSIAILAALPTLAPAQSLDLKGSLSRLGGTYLYDPAQRKPILAVTYETSRLTSFLGKKGFDLSICGIAGAAGSGAALGVGALYKRDLAFRLSDELRGSVALTVGPVLLYGTNGGKMRLGAALGLGFKL